MNTSSRPAIAATSRGIHEPVRTAIPRPDISRPATVDSIFSKFQPFFSASCRPVANRDSPLTTIPIPAPSFPKAIQRPSVSSAEPFSISRKLSMLTPFCHASHAPFARSMPPRMATSRPTNFVSPSIKPLESFHASSAAPIRFTQFRIFSKSDAILEVSKEKSGFIAEPPPPEDPLDSLLISSKLAKDLVAFFAALPVASIASASSYIPLAASFVSPMVLPNSKDTIPAIALTMRVRTLTNAVNTGIRTDIIGCARVSSAPFSRAIAADASLLDLITLPIQSFTDRSAVVISVKTKTRLAKLLRRLENFFIRWSACSTALATASAAVAGL